jgi:hypothetical protein
MSHMRDLLESMNKFAGERVGQKPGDQVRGSEPIPRKGGYKKHPYAGRLVGGGAAESVEENEEYCDACDRVKSKCVCDDKLKESLAQEYRQYIAEYGAPGSGIGNDVSITPQDQVAQRQQKVASKAEAQNQVSGLMAQVQGARSQLAQMNKQFPQGANPVEKAMSLKDMQSQKVQLGRQIEDLMGQVAAARKGTV